MTPKTEGAVTDNQDESKKRMGRVLKIYSFLVQSAPCLGPVGLDAGGKQPVARVQRCRHLRRLPVLKLKTKSSLIGNETMEGNTEEENKRRCRHLAFEHESDRSQVRVFV